MNDKAQFELTGKIIFYSSIFGWLILFFVKMFINKPFIWDLYNLFFNIATYSMVIYIIAGCYIKIKNRMNKK